MNIKRNLVLTVIFMISATTTFAQTNFTGTWTQFSKEQISGPEYANSIPKRVKVNQQTDDLIIERISTGAGEDQTLKESLKFKLSPAGISTVGDQKKTANIKWSPDNKAFTETANYAGSDGKTTRQIIEDWQLSDNGSILTITRTFQSATDSDDKWSVKATYKKQ